MSTPASSPPPDQRAALGAYGERIAVRVLTDAGLRVLDRNWRTRAGELDLVARDDATIVFCEVKTRRAQGYGHPVEAVTPDKRRRLRALARAWLDAHDEHAPDLRFDVIGVLVPGSGRPRVVHLRNAF
ncbi:YraN family protein [Modestobacter sp. NPDC049651]|uniref:YraN family protein n=1 Tax=unclassified Modestobacter TaxID=2643866 RepID=UPI00340DF425